jgi:hypothetical protein
MRAQAVRGRGKMLHMKKPTSMNFAVFVIFFGIALIEAVQKGNWLEAGLFAALGLLSLYADFKK